MKGWAASDHRYSHRGNVPDSPGYTTEQKAALARLNRRLLRLATAVVDHTWWKSLEGEDRVKARMALKRTTHAEPT
ncbi:hypothetical protein ACFY15_36330 [Streptomyces sp. NPDC001373]|uniref:hypothetical protein n=1 Tax=Streptomyces sp. NPDC001373 TaxID=3364565 RepID=UPI0036AAB203